MLRLRELPLWPYVLAAVRTRGEVFSGVGWRLPSPEQEELLGSADASYVLWAGVHADWTDAPGPRSAPKRTVEQLMRLNLDKTFSYSAVRTVCGIDMALCSEAPLGDFEPGGSVQTVLFEEDAS